MSPDDFWDGLKAIGLTRVRRLTRESVLCQDREGEYISVEEPLLLTEEQRISAFAYYRRVVNPFDN